MGCILLFVVFYVMGVTVLKIGYEHFHIIVCQGGWVHVLIGDETEVLGFSSLHCSLHLVHDHPL